MQMQSSPPLPQMSFIFIDMDTHTPLPSCNASGSDPMYICITMKCPHWVIDSFLPSPYSSQSHTHGTSWYWYSTLHRGSKVENNSHVLEVEVISRTACVFSNGKHRNPRKRTEDVALSLWNFLEECLIVFQTTSSSRATTADR